MLRSGGVRAMATPRKRWFKVASSLYREPWPRETKLTLVMLMGYLNDRWARDGLTAEQACSAELDRGTAEQITGKYHRKSQRNQLEMVAKYVSISVGSRSGFITIHWPKFAEFQDLGAREMPSPKTRTEDAYRIPKREAPAAPPPAAKSPRSQEPRKRRTLCPELLTVEQWTQIHAWRDSGHRPFDDDELSAQWTRHYQHHAGKGNLAINWVLSFYNWLTGPYYQPASGGTSKQSGARYVKSVEQTQREAAARSGDGEPVDPESSEWTDAMAQARAQREKWPKKRAPRTTPRAARGDSS